MLWLGAEGPGEGFIANGGEALHFGEDFEGGPWACAVALGLQAHAHAAVEGEGQEADQRMRPDSVRQAMMDRRDLDVGFQDAAAALDVGEALLERVARIRFHILRL